MSHLSLTPQLRPGAIFLTVIIIFSFLLPFSAPCSSKFPLTMFFIKHGAYSLPCLKLHGPFAHQPLMWLSQPNGWGHLPQGLPVTPITLHTPCGYIQPRCPFRAFSGKATFQLFICSNKAQNTLFPVFPDLGEGGHFYQVLTTELIAEI